MKNYLVTTLCLLLLAIGTGARADDLGKHFKASMVVTGAITINPDGSVNSYALDQQDKLPEGVIAVMRATLPNWKFQPVLADGKPVMAKSGMSVRVVATPVDDGHATVQVSGAQFGMDTAKAKQSPQCANGACLTSNTKKAPQYPIGAIREGVSGIVYLVQEIGRDGRVERQAVKQVDLRNRGNAAKARRLSKMLSDASLEAARSWTYNIPTTGVEAGRDHWIVTTPINYTLGGVYAYGQWDPYIPGEVQDVPWADTAKHLASDRGGDAVLATGGSFLADSRFVLLTPLGS